MPAPTDPVLSIVLPVYNEQKVLKNSLDVISGYIGSLELPFEIVAVDDGSSDESRRILDEHASEDPRLRVLALAQNQGKGAAVRHGVLESRGQLVFFMDADLSTPLTEIPSFLESLDQGFDVVLGNRRIAGSSITRRQPFLREALGKGFTTLTRTLVAPGITDFTCGFKAFTQDAAREVFSRSTLSGWAFDAELVAIAQEQGLRITQLPVSWAHEDDTKVALGSAVVRSLKEILMISFRRSRGDYR
ncbi:MAG: dolichyl-phosphate beta-glucosyltransferase [Planctomycetota bacterium]|jgi:dolichyl-phosphate beta-glucosyltransferase